MDLPAEGLGIMEKSPREGGTPVETSFAQDEVLLFAKLVASEYAVEFEQFELRPVLTHHGNITRANIREAGGIVVDG